jgi:hypothetical protein
MKLSFLVPFRDVDGTRTRAKDWILARWKHFYPDAEFCLAPDDGVDPFNKSLAVNTAAKQATGDVFVILDADTWIDLSWMEKGLQQLGRYPWVIPARKSYRLTQEASEAILRLPASGEMPRLVNRRTVVEQTGPVVGFIHIVPRQGFEMIAGMDERYRGWGGEDSSFVRALDVVWGRHIQLPGSVISLWHARPRGAGGRIWEGQTADHYIHRSELAKRYSLARTKAQMLALMQEKQDHANPEVVTAA